MSFFFFFFFEFFFTFLRRFSLFATRSLALQHIIFVFTLLYLCYFHFLEIFSIQYVLAKLDFSANQQRINSKKIYISIFIFILIWHLSKYLNFATQQVKLCTIRWKWKQKLEKKENQWRKKKLTKTKAKMYIRACVCACV